MTEIRVPYFPQFTYQKPDVWITIKSHKIAHANWKNYPYQPKVTFKIVHNGKMLFINYDILEYYPVRAVNTKDQDPVYQDSCVEFFILDQTGDYHNFEFNAKGVALSAKGANRNERISRKKDEMQSIVRLPSPIEKVVNGYHWTLTVGIPFASVGLTHSTSFRANFYKCGDLTEKKHYLSWHKINTKNPDFHRPEHFGIIVIE